MKTTAVILLLCSALGWAAAPPVAVVNGVPIASEDFQRSYDAWKATFIAQGVPEDMIEHFGVSKNALDKLIDEELLVELARSRGVTITDPAVRDAVEASKKESGLDAAGFAAHVAKNAGSMQHFEALVRRSLAAEVLLAEIDATVTVTEGEVHDRCRRETDLASIAVVEFAADDYVSEVKQPADKVLAAWRQAHEAELAEQFKREAYALTNNQGRLFYADGVPFLVSQRDDVSIGEGEHWAIPQKRKWIVGDAKKVRGAFELSQYVAAQAKSLARRDAAKALADVKKGKKLDALFPDAVTRTRSFSPVDTYAGPFAMTPELSAAVFGRKTPGPVGTVISARDSELVVLVEQRKLLDEAVCRTGAAAWREELRREKQDAARGAFLRSLREKATITTNQAALNAIIYREP